MKPDLGDLPFSVELKLRLSQLSFGRHMAPMDLPSDFSELDALGEPVFSGQCFFGRNNLGLYPDEYFGVNCQTHGRKEARISDGILGRVFETGFDYSVARIYAEDETCAQVDIFLQPNIFEKIYLAKSAVNFHLITSFNVHKNIVMLETQEKNKLPDNILIEGEPGKINVTNKFTLDIDEKDFGRWYFRVRLVSLDFSCAVRPPLSFPLKTGP